MAVKGRQVARARLRCLAEVESGCRRSISRAAVHVGEQRVAIDVGDNECSKPPGWFKSVGQPAAWLCPAGCRKGLQPA